MCAVIGDTQEARDQYTTDGILNPGIRYVINNNDTGSFVLSNQLGIKGAKKVYQSGDKIGAKRKPAGFMREGWTPDSEKVAPAPMQDNTGLGILYDRGKGIMGSGSPNTFVNRPTGLYKNVKSQ